MTSACPSIYTTCPEFACERPPVITARVLETARWCEAHSHTGMLIRSNNRLLDPWTVAQVLLHETESLRPVITVHPLYMHPYTVAKKVASLASVYGRTPDLYLLAGDSNTDLLAFDDRTPHDDRYRRLTEYVEIIAALLTAHRPITHVGKFYRIYKPAALAPLTIAQRPRFFIETSSSAGQRTANDVGALAVSWLGSGDSAECIFLGMVVRPTCEEAWEIARARFKTDAAGRLAHRLDMAWNDSRWHERLSHLTDTDSASQEGLWLKPFENRQSRSGYLVGNPRMAARSLQDSLIAGARTFFLEPPHCYADVEHASKALERAWTRFQSPLTLTA